MTRCCIFNVNLQCANSLSYVHVTLFGLLNNNRLTARFVSRLRVFFFLSLLEFKSITPLEQTEPSERRTVIKYLHYNKQLI